MKSNRYLRPSLIDRCVVVMATRSGNTAGRCFKSRRVVHVQLASRPIPETAARGNFLAKVSLISWPPKSGEEPKLIGKTPQDNLDRGGEGVNVLLTKNHLPMSLESGHVHQRIFLRLLRKCADEGEGHVGASPIGRRGH